MENMNDVNQPTSLVHLVACPRPFSTAQIVRQVPEGSTIAELLRGIGLNPDPLFARVFIDDRLILKAEWEYATPKAGQLVTARVIPTGGGGGGKDALRIVAQIGIMIAAMAASMVNPAFGALVMIGGTFLVNGLIPHPLPRRTIPIGFEERSRKEAA
jgi:sulfur carrier protein ThiS